MNAYSTGKGAFPASSVVADDKAMTLTVKMENPTADWPAIVSHSVFSPIPTSMVGASEKVDNVLEVVLVKSILNTCDENDYIEVET